MFHPEYFICKYVILAISANTNPKKDEMLPMIEKLHKDKKSLREIEAELKKLGYTVGKSSIGNYVKELKTANIIENGKSGN